MQKTDMQVQLQLSAGSCLSWLSQWHGTQSVDKLRQQS